MNELLEATLSWMRSASDSPEIRAEKARGDAEVRRLSDEFDAKVKTANMVKLQMLWSKPIAEMPRA